MARQYFLLLTHFFVCILIFTVIPYISDPDQIPYGIIALCFVITLLITGVLFLRYPTERLNPFTLLSIIYSLQFSLSIYLIRFHEIVSWRELVSYYNNISVANLMSAMQLTYIFSFVSLFIAFLFSKSIVWDRILSLMRRTLIRERKLLSLFVICITLTEFVLLATGRVTLQGESLIGKNLKNIEVNPLVAIVGPIACLAVFVSAYQYAGSRDKRLILLLLIQFAWFFLWGRRQILYFTFLAFVGFYFDQKIVLGNLRRIGIRKVIVAGLLFIVVISAAKLYQQLRTIGGVKVLQHLNIKTIQRVYRIYSSTDTRELMQASQYNIEIRALSTMAAVAFYDKLIETKNIQRGNGLEIYNSILKVTPSNYIVDKSSIQVTEGLAAMLTHGEVSRTRDLGGSLILESMIDFGRLGVFLYPMIMAMMIIFFYWILLKFGNPVAIVWFVVALLYSILSMVEGSIADMFLAMRATILIVFILIIRKFFLAMVNDKRPLSAAPTR